MIKVKTGAAGATLVSTKNSSLKCLESHSGVAALVPFIEFRALFLHETGVTYVVRILLLVALLNLVGPQRAPADEKSVSVDEIQSIYHCQQAQLRKVRAGSLNKAKLDYITAVKVLRRKFQQEGDLDRVLKLDDEVAMIASSEMSSQSGLPVDVMEPRRKFDELLKKQELDYQHSSEQAQSQFLTSLQDLEKSETRAGRLDAAQKVRTLRLAEEKQSIPQFVARDLPASSVAINEWVDLLAWTESVPWQQYGYDWNTGLELPVSKSGLRTQKTEAHRVYPFAAVINGDYELEVEVTRTDGEADVGLILPVGNQVAVAVFGVTNLNADWLGSVDGKWLEGNPTLKSPTPFKSGVKHKIRAVVRRDPPLASIDVYIDGDTPHISWKGEEWDLNSVVDLPLWSSIGQPGIYLFHSAVEVHSAKVRMLSGTIHRAFPTRAEMKHDLRRGTVKLTGLTPQSASVGWSRPSVNQLFDVSPFNVADHWPLISRQFEFCEDYYGAHAPATITAAVPKGAKSFSVVGTNEASRATRFIARVDGIAAYESGVTHQAIVRIDIPDDASILELQIDDVGSQDFDHSYWCYPRFHEVSSNQVSDDMLDSPPGKFRFEIRNSVVEADRTTARNQLSHPYLTCPPIHFRDATPCHEFYFAHSPSSITLAVPDGMTRFTGIGYNVKNHHVTYEVWADGNKIFDTGRAGIVPIDLQLPKDTKLLDLRVNDLGTNSNGYTFWCYPRLHRR